MVPWAHEEHVDMFRLTQVSRLPNRSFQLFVRILPQKTPMLFTGADNPQNAFSPWGIWTQLKHVLGPLESTP